MRDKLSRLGLLHMVRYSDGKRADNGGLKEPHASIEHPVTGERVAPTAAHHALKSWQDTYGTNDRAVVEKGCQARNLTCHWREDGVFEGVNKVSAFIEHPLTGEHLLFTTPHHATYRGWEPYNSLPATSLPYVQFWGDGSEMTLEEAAALEAAMKAAEVPPGGISLAEGDFLILDNLRFSHGRAAYTGKRMIATALGDPLEGWKLRVPYGDAVVGTTACGVGTSTCGPGAELLSVA